MVDEKAVVLDADGVLLNFDHSFVVLGKKVLGADLQQKNSSYNLTERYGLTDEEVSEIWISLCADGFGGLPLLLGAFESVERLKKIGCKIHVITGIPEEASHLRLKNFKEHGIHVDSIDCVGLNEKLPFIEKYRPVAVVDDRLVNLKNIEFVPNRIWVDRGDHQDGHTESHATMRVDSLSQWVDHWVKVRPEQKFQKRKI